MAQNSEKLLLKQEEDDQVRVEKLLVAMKSVISPEMKLLHKQISQAKLSGTVSTLTHRGGSFRLT